MSEKIFAFLLRLYPSGFRKAYGNEAVQLVRDRLHDEQGFNRRLRLWLDLLSDLAVSLPREYRHAQPLLAETRTPQGLQGVPSFHVLEEESIGAGTLLAAVVLFLAALGTLSMVMKHAVEHRSSADASLRRANAERSRWAASPGSTPSLNRNAGGAAAMSPQADQALPQSRAVPLSRATPYAAIDIAERRRVVSAAITNLKQHYFDSEAAANIAHALQRHENSGDYDGALDGPAFAALLTRHMREVAQDMHLTLDYSRDRLPDHPPVQTPEDLARYSKYLQENRCFFQSVAMLPHAVGYLRIDGFADVSVCRSMAESNMDSVNRAHALIFDLRGNRGGDPGMVSFIASYLFNHPAYWYNPRGDALAATTPSPVPGNRLADKPVYLLTSASTWSAAE